MSGTQLRPVDITPILRPERAALIELLARLDDDAWAAPTECPEWDVKGIALHVLGDDFSLLSRQRDDATEGLILYAEHHPGLEFRQLLDGFNEQWVTAASFMGRRLLLDLLELTGEWSADYYSAVDPQRPGEVVGFFGATDASPYWQIAAREYVERWAHQHQIRRAVGEPDLGAEFLGPALEVIVSAISGHLAWLEPEPDTRLGFVVPGVAEWTLTRNAAGWVAAPGATHDADLTISVAADTATTVLSRGMTAGQIGDVLVVSGDDELASSVVAFLVPFMARP